MPTLRYLGVPCLSAAFGTVSRFLQLVKHCSTIFLHLIPTYIPILIFGYCMLPVVKWTAIPQSHEITIMWFYNQYFFTNYTSYSVHYSWVLEIIPINIFLINFVYKHNVSALLVENSQTEILKPRTKILVDIKLISSCNHLIF